MFMFNPYPNNNNNFLLKTTIKYDMMFSLPPYCEIFKNLFFFFNVFIRKCTIYATYIIRKYDNKYTEFVFT